MATATVQIEKTLPQIKKVTMVMSGAQAKAIRAILRHVSTGHFYSTNKIENMGLLDLVDAMDIHGLNDPCIKCEIKNGLICV
jgi:hypothetical protein